MKKNKILKPIWHEIIFGEFLETIKVYVIVTEGRVVTRRFLCQILHSGKFKEPNIYRPDQKVIYNHYVAPESLRKIDPVEGKEYGNQSTLLQQKS